MTRRGLRPPWNAQGEDTKRHWNTVELNGSERVRFAINMNSCVSALRSRARQPKWREVRDSLCATPTCAAYQRYGSHFPTGTVSSMRPRETHSGNWCALWLSPTSARPDTETAWAHTPRAAGLQQVELPQRVLLEIQAELVDLRPATMLPSHAQDNERHFPPQCFAEMQRCTQGLAPARLPGAPTESPSSAEKAGLLEPGAEESLNGSAVGAHGIGTWGGPSCRTSERSEATTATPTAFRRPSRSEGLTLAGANLDPK